MELDFRAYDEATQSLIYSYQIAGGVWQYFKTLEDRGIRHFQSDQYIGVKDINGVKIYRGDKVRLVSQQIFKTNKPYLYDKIVEWNGKTCGWNIRPSRKNHKGYLIIGNIYENKEIMSKPKKEKTFIELYEKAIKEGEARFGSECPHTETKDGVCLKCLRKIRDY